MGPEMSAGAGELVSSLLASWLDPRFAVSLDSAKSRRIHFTVCFCRHPPQIANAQLNARIAALGSGTMGRGTVAA